MTSIDAKPVRIDKTRRAVSASLLLGSAGISLAAEAPPTVRRPIVIQFSHVVKPETAKGRAALRFKQLAEERTGGRVRVEVYPDSQLYKDREELEALRIGAVQMLATSLSKLSSVGSADFEVFDLPFLFPNHAAFRSAVDGALGQTLLKQLEPNGLKGLAFWDNGFKVFTANRPLRVPNDFKGLKVRVQASRVLVSQMKTLGADVSVSPLANVYEALRTGQLDGQENVPSNIYSQRLHEVQSHMTVTRHGYLAYAVLVNRAFWDKLPEDIRMHLEGALKDAASFANSIAEADNAQALKRIRDESKLVVHEPTPSELALWRQAMAPVFSTAKSRFSEQVLTALRRQGIAPP